MDKLRVIKKDHSDLFIETEINIEYELSEYFSFMVEGHKFMPAFRQGRWDGKKRLFDRRKKILPVGLYPMLKKFCADNGYKIEIVDSEFGKPNERVSIDVNEIMKYIQDLNLHAGSNKIDIYEYQFNTVCACLEHKRKTVLSPTGSGKSLIFYVIIRWLLEKTDGKILLFVPTTALVEQMYTDFEEYSQFDDSWNVNDECHKIYSGKEKVNIYHRVFISTWQSIYKLPKTWFKKFTTVLGDECHLASAECISSILKKSVNAHNRIGMTGTLNGTKIHELVLQGMFGDIFKIVSTKDLQEDNKLADLEINMIELVYPKDIRKSFGKKKYHDEIDWIVRNETRNNFLINLMLSLKGNTLGLFQYIEKHGDVLYKETQDKNNDDSRKIFYAAGKVDKMDREAIRGLVEKLKNACIWASFGVFSTGTNIKNIHNMIFASPSKSLIRILQSIGRGLRLSDNGQATVLYDVIDNLVFGNRKNYAMKHAEERYRIYINEGFKVKKYRIEL